jgi:hypothetical protein
VFVDQQLYIGRHGPRIRQIQVGRGIQRVAVSREGPAGASARPRFMFSTRLTTMRYSHMRKLLLPTNVDSLVISLTRISCVGSRRILWRCGLLPRSYPKFRRVVGATGFEPATPAPKAC